MGNFSRMTSRLEFRKRLAKKSEVYFGTLIESRPDVEMENFTPLESAFLRTITSPNSLSLIIIFCRNQQDLPKRGESGFQKYVFRIG